MDAPRVIQGTTAWILSLLLSLLSLCVPTASSRKPVQPLHTVRFMDYALYTRHVYLWTRTRFQGYKPNGLVVLVSTKKGWSGFLPLSVCVICSVALCIYSSANQNRRTLAFSQASKFIPSSIKERPDCSFIFPFVNTNSLILRLLIIFPQNWGTEATPLPKGGGEYRGY